MRSNHLQQACPGTLFERIQDRLPSEWLFIMIAFSRVLFVCISTASHSANELNPTIHVFPLGRHL